ncbi:MAG: PAS domain S-box protein [Sphingomonadales bacterium]|nr:PAS domain S-box protein [Sphingomonadales bacterium]
MGWAVLLGLAMFVAVSVCLAYLGTSDRAVGFWLANGIALAVLLRTPRHRWPLLIVFAFLGNLAAALLLRRSGLLYDAISCASNVVQFALIAYVLRARFGAYFDLLQAREVGWLCALSVPATALKGLVQWFGAAVTGGPGVVVNYAASWFLSCLLGLFVLSLPLLAISSARSERQVRFDALGFALIGILTVLAVAIYGPMAFDGIYMIMPPLMLLAWRYGLVGAGIGALVNNVLGAVLAITTEGITARLMETGYDADQVGIYLELFFNAAILISLPVAVARAQQKATDAALAAALASAERRATQLADSEAAIRKNQEILQQSEQRFRHIFEHAPLGIALVDTETQLFRAFNPKFRAIAGWPTEALLQKTWMDITHPDLLGDEMEKSRPFLNGVEPDFRAEKSYVRADGKAVWVNMTVTRIPMPGPERERFLVMTEDITERKALQHQLDVVQRLEAVGQLTGGIAHDFNNLLTVIIGSSEALAEEIEDPDQRELAGLILDTAERAGELTRHLLAFARRQPLSPRAFDVNQLLDGCEALIRRTLGANLHFSVEKVPGVRLAFADRGQTESAILNLCLNARDAMPNGGRLTISTANAVFDDEFVRSHSGARPGEYVAVRVSDTGSGIPAEILDHIFEPFFTTKPAGRGTGLGLSMVYGFTKQSHGYIDVATEEGKGTTFSLFLPLGQVQDRPEDAAAKGAARRGTETILLVEDDHHVRGHVANQLKGLGYQIVEAEDGPGAIAILEQRRDIALLFTDLMMPGGMNGRELAEQATTIWPDLHVLFSSGYANEMLIENGRLMEGVALLSKPYSRRQLADKIREALDVPA